VILELLIQTCTVPDTPPAVIEQIIAVESNEREFAINVNSEKPVLITQPENLEEAISSVEKYIAQGYTVDMGYMQINSQHLEKYDVTVGQVFDPCQNIYIGSDIFMRGYNATKAFYGDTPLALETALSAYNTGTFHRGFQNGYTTRYEPQTAAAPSPSKPEDYEARHSPMSVTLNFANPHKEKAPSEEDALKAETTNSTNGE